VPSSFHEAVLYRDAELVDRLRTVLCDIDRARATVEGLADAMSSFAWEVVAPRYDQCLVRLVDDYRPIP
jgi:hypothetical protein